MEGELIIVTLISSMFGMFGLWMINRNWFKRQDIKYKYQIKRAKLSQRLQTPVKDEPSPMDSLSQLLPLLKGLDSDQIGSLIDTFLGGGELPSDLGGLEGILEKIPPDVITSFLEGLSKPKDQKENKIYES